jgi:predicted acylesterase/phospholipase RssA
MVDSKTIDVPVNVIAVNLETGEPQVFSYKDPDFDKAVLASASIPGVFPPVNIRGNWYVDGAIREYTPLSYVLSDQEVERVVVISTRPRDSERRAEVGRNVRPWEMATSTLPIMVDEIFMGDFNTFETINRAVQQAEENGNQFLKKDGTPYKRYEYIYVEPEENFGSALDFNPERNKRLMAAGREAARKSLDNYL